MPPRRPTALAALLALLLAAPLRADASDVRRLESWAAMQGGARERIELPDVVSAVAGAVASPGGPRLRADRALLAFAGAAHAAPGDPLERERLAAALDGVRRRLAGEGGPGFLALLCDQVLLQPASFGAEERLGACAALLGVPGERPVLPLVAATADPDPRVAEAALAALVGRASPAVHRRFLDGAEAGAAGQRLLVRHLEALERAAGPGADPGALLEARERGRVAELARAALVAEDWRAALPGVRLARFLGVRVAAPMLVEALELWTLREAALPEDEPPVGARRLRYEVAGVLEERTGARIGPHPERWRAFWESVREAPDEALRTSGEQLAAGGTVASFFGVELRTGAVAFVLDASGSMDNAWLAPGSTLGAEGRPPSRFRVACGQLAGFLAAGSPPPWFELALFADQGQRWRSAPTQADADGRRAVDAWLRSQSPSGGTHLGAGLEALLGRPDAGGAERPAFDTVVVLCDGETVEDAAWARAWLAGHPRTAGLVFHCVQIGTGDGGALRALAEETGGLFQRAGG